MEREADRVNIVSPLINTRVLKAHVDAVENNFEEALAIKKVVGKRGAAEHLALACLSATDSKPSYVAVVLEGDRQYIFGDYKSVKAAWKAIERGCVGSRSSARGYVAPLIPAPKLKYLGKFVETEQDKSWD